MIAIATKSTARSIETSSQRAAGWHGRFLKLLPDIRRHARFRFRRLRAEDREENVQEVTAIAMHAFIQLWRQGREDVAYAAPLAGYAAARVRDGRCLGTRRNKRDVTSIHCRRQGVEIESLDQRADHDGKDGWRQLVVECRAAGPAETAAARLDLAAWLRTLPRRHRQIAEVLASGETTNATAELFNISAGRISQVRRQLYVAWQTFQGDGGASPLPNPA